MAYFFIKLNINLILYINSKLNKLYNNENIYYKIK